MNHQTLPGHLITDRCPSVPCANICRNENNDNKEKCKTEKETQHEAFLELKEHHIVNFTNETQEHEQLSASKQPLLACHENNVSDNTLSNKPHHTIMVHHKTLSNKPIDYLPKTTLEIQSIG